MFILSFIFTKIITTLGLILGVPTLLGTATALFGWLRFI